MRLNLNRSAPLPRRCCICCSSKEIGGDLILPKPQFSSVAAVRSKYNAASLAFLGDGVFEANLRLRYFGPGTQPLNAYNLDVKRHSSAAQQVNGSHASVLSRQRSEGIVSSLPQAVYHDWLVKEAAAASTEEDADDEAGPDSTHDLCAEDRSASESIIRTKHEDPVSTTSTPLTALRLTAEELDVLRWARNSSSISPPRGMDSLQYKKATALEVLVSCGGVLLMTARHALCIN